MPVFTPPRLPGFRCAACGQPAAKHAPGTQECPTIAETAVVRAEELMREEISYAALPLALRGGMRKWITQGVKPGGFLVAMLENNLSETVARADAFNEGRLAVLVRWLHRQAPGMCWGSPERVANWPSMLAELKRHNDPEN